MLKVETDTNKFIEYRKQKIFWIGFLWEGYTYTIPIHLSHSPPSDVPMRTRVRVRMRYVCGHLTESGFESDSGYIYEYKVPNAFPIELN